MNWPDVLPRERTVLVLGLPRGGTSFITSTLANLGVPLDQTPPNYDNPEVAYATHDADWERLRRYIQAMDDRYPIWGAKIPGPVNVTEAVGHFRYPMLIYVFRDPAAIVGRKQMLLKSAFSNTWHGIQKVLSDYTALTEMVMPLTAPTLLVSYGSASRYVPDFVQIVNDFIGASEVPLSAEEVERVAGKVLDHGAAYRKSAHRKAKRLSRQRQRETLAVQAHRAERKAERLQRQQKEALQVQAHRAERKEERRQRRMARRLEGAP